MQSSKDSLAAVARYVTKEEWAELASATNKSYQKHSPMSNPVSIVPCVATCTVCFCPFCYFYMTYEANVNTDVAKSTIAQKLKERGITLQWVAKTKFDAGGMTLMLSPQTPPAPAEQKQQGMMQVVVPAGLGPGAAFAVQAPDGLQMQVVVPPTSQAGDTINIMPVAPQAEAITR